MLSYASPGKLQTVGIGAMIVVVVVVVGDPSALLQTRKMSANSLMMLYENFAYIVG